MYYTNMIYGKMLQESTADTAFANIQKEYTNFKNIIESVTCLHENNIILEKIDMSKIGQKIVKIWNAIKEFFKKYVIGTFRNLFEKIFSKKVQKDIEEIKKETKPEVLRIEMHTDSNTSAESAENKEEKLKAFVEESICPTLFFKLSDYVDTSELAKANRESVNLYHKMVDILLKMNFTSDKDVAKGLSDENSEFYKVMEEGQDLVINAYNKSFKSDFDIKALNDINSFATFISEKIKEKMPKTISFKDLLTTIETNIKDADNEINGLKEVVKISEEEIKYFDSIIKKETNNLNKYSVELFSKMSSQMKDSTKLYSDIIKYVSTLYTKASTTLEAMKALNANA